MHDAAWVLPDTPCTGEKLQWLAAEIVEMSGEAHLWDSRPALPGQDEALARLFLEQAYAAYRAMLDGLKRADRDLAALAQQYQQARQKDFFNSKLGQDVYQALLTALEGQDQ